MNQIYLPAELSVKIKTEPVIYTAQRFLSTT